MISASNSNKMKSCVLLVLLFIADCKAKPSSRRWNKDTTFICERQTKRGMLDLETTITSFKRCPVAGMNFTYYCKYNEVYKTAKFICKGEDKLMCQHLVSTTKPDINTRFSMEDDTAKKNITITLKEVTAADSGTYWCGVESTDELQSGTFLHRMTLDVVPGPKESSDSEEDSKEGSPQPGCSSDGCTVDEAGSGTTPFLIVGGVLLALLLATALILLFKRCSHAKHVRTRTAEQHPREDYFYEEIHANHQVSRSENTVTSIYATVKMPKEESDLLHYATVNFNDRSADGNRLVKTNSSCLYSTVRPSQGPVGSTRNLPDPQTNLSTQ